MPENAADMVALSFLRWLMAEDQGRAAQYRAYREYYDGEHATQLTNRQRRFLELKTGTDFRDNYCPLVADSLVERLKVTGFKTQSDELSGLLWEWWQRSRMDAQQVDVYLAAARDGDGYVIVEWDEERGIPTFEMNLAYDGTDGVKMHYADNRRGVPTFASKRWVVSEPGDGGGYRRRLNVYYPDRIEKWVSDSRENDGQWQRYEEEGEPWPRPWLASDGSPLGIPVVHFAYRAGGYNFGRSRLDDVIPLQNALNKTLIDLIASADAHGFPMYSATGIDDPDALNVGPGRLLYSSKPDARFGVLPPGDLSQLLALKDSVTFDVARVSNTPLSRFQITGHVASEGTLKQQESGLVADAETTQVTFGNRWEDVLSLGRRLYNTFGPGGLDEDAIIDTDWAPAATRDENALAQRYKIWADSFHIPDEIIWTRIGLTPEEIEQALASPQYQEYRAMRQAGLLLNEENRGGEPTDNRTP